ncbi:MAG: NTP transferase domain-containing protein, partial [Bacillota bacterium]
GPLKELSGTGHEALIKIANVPMIEYVIKAAHNAKSTGKIIVVGPKGALENNLKELIKEQVDVFVESGNSIKDNIMRGIDIIKESQYVLLMTSDIPLITADVIDEYIHTCGDDSGADLYYPIIPKEDNQARFPMVKRTYFHLSEGVFTGGNMVIIKPDVLIETTQLLDRIISLRKKPWKLSKILGMKFILKYALGHLSIDEIESKVAKITGCNGHFMITNHPEIGFDVDKPSDLQVMRDKFIS